MMFADIPLLSMLKDRLSYLSQRQQVIGQNVANSDTPGYMPRDLQPFALPRESGASGGSLTLASVESNPAFLAGSRPPAAAQAWKPHNTPDSETRLDGNHVVLEEEMLKMQESRLNYETALGLYQKSMAMLQLAIKAPGKP
jgi:flagellar basal-body rod protein FlgB